MKIMIICFVLLMTTSSFAASNICGRIGGISAGTLPGGKGEYVTLQVGKDEVILTGTAVISVALLAKQLDRDVCLSSQNNLGRFEKVELKD